MNETTMKYSEWVLLSCKPPGKRHFQGSDWIWVIYQLSTSLTIRNKGMTLVNAQIDFFNGTLTFEFYRFGIVRDKDDFLSVNRFDLKFVPLFSHSFSCPHFCITSNVLWDCYMFMFECRWFSFCKRGAYMVQERCFQLFCPPWLLRWECSVELHVHFQSWLSKNIT